MNKPIKLMIVDDSKLMRGVLSDIFTSSDDVEVIGEAVNGKDALEQIPILDPDVLTLDIEMPIMDGLTTLKHIMIRYPRPVVMCSTLTKEGATVTFDALKYGAVDFVHKPSNHLPAGLEQQCRTLREKVKAATNVEIEAAKFMRSASKKNETPKPGSIDCRYICGIGASEGGYSALLKIIPRLRADLPAAFIIVLYTPPEHVSAFAKYLDKSSPIRVERATDGTIVKGGTCYLAAGTEYATVHISGEEEYYLSVNESPFPNRRGAANMLMMSLAEVMKYRAIGMVLSGEGDDGMEGIEEIYRWGGHTVVQDPKTCLYKETPKIAIENCEVNLVCPDAKIADEIEKHIDYMGGI